MFPSQSLHDDYLEEEKKEWPTNFEAEELADYGARVKIMQAVQTDKLGHPKKRKRERN